MLLYGRQIEQLLVSNSIIEASTGIHEIVTGSASRIVEMD